MSQPDQSRPVPGPTAPRPAAVPGPAALHPAPVPAPVAPRPIAVPGPTAPRPSPAPGPAVGAPTPTVAGESPFIGLPGRPVAEHVAVFEAEHDRLQRELATIDQL